MVGFELVLLKDDLIVRSLEGREVVVGFRDEERGYRWIDLLGGYDMKGQPESLRSRRRAKRRGREGGASSRSVHAR